MKRLYKLIFLFFIIFFIGIFLTVRSINNSFSSSDEIETVSSQTQLINLSIKI